MCYEVELKLLDLYKIEKKQIHLQLITPASFIVINYTVQTKWLQTKICQTCITLYTENLLCVDCTKILSKNFGGASTPTL